MVVISGISNQMKSGLQPNALKVQVFVSRKRDRTKSSRKSISMQSLAVGIAKKKLSSLLDLHREAQSSDGAR